MDELFEQMLTTDVLSDETKTALKEAFKAEVEKAADDARQVAIAEAKVEFAKQFAEDKDALVEALDTKVTSLLAEEIQELKEDIERFRDLEAEFAVKLVEEKEAMGLQLKADMAQLVETLDVFLEQRVTEEMEELKESIEEVKKIEFAKNLFESIEDTFRTKFFNESGFATQLDETKKELDAKAKKLEEAQNQLNKFVREKELSRVLEPLHGRPREIMEAILKSVVTDKLDEGYTNFIGRVLHESASTVENKSEKENVSTSVLAESDSTAETPEATKVVTGDSTVVEQVDGVKQSFLSESDKGRLRKLAGI